MSSNPFDDDAPTSSDVELAPEVLEDVDVIMRASSFDDLMKPEDAAALRAILAALHNFPELEEFIAAHCAEFREWAADCELPLHWTELHAHFVALVEHRIESLLEAHDATVADLYALLAESCANDPRANRFLATILSLNDFVQFCLTMQMHAVALGLESVALA